MRKLFMCLLFIAVCVGAGADSPSNPSFIPAEWYQNLSLFFRTATNPPKIIPVMASDGYRLPVAMASGSASVTAAEAPVTAYSTTFITATETPTLITLLAGVTEMTLVASSPFEVYLGTGAVTASSTPIYNMTLPVSPGAAVYVGQSSAVQPRITVYQVAR